jgi:hypothetical protein
MRDRYFTKDEPERTAKPTKEIPLGISSIVMAFALRVLLIVWWIGVFGCTFATLGNDPCGNFPKILLSLIIFGTLIGLGLGIMALVKRGRDNAAAIIGVALNGIFLLFIPFSWMF